jgi:hypothetical protein
VQRRHCRHASPVFGAQGCEPDYRWVRARLYHTHPSLLLLLPHTLMLLLRIEPTEIYTKKASVEEENQLRLNQLSGERMVYDALDTGSSTARSALFDE